MDTEDTAHTEITAMLTWFKALRPFCISLRAKPHQYFWPCSIILLEYPVQFSQFNQLKTSKTCFRERQRYVFLTLCMWSAFVLASNINKVVTFNRSSQKLSQCTLDHAYGRQNSSWCPWDEASTWKKTCKALPRKTSPQLGSSLSLPYRVTTEGNNLWCS